MILPTVTLAVIPLGIVDAHGARLGRPSAQSGIRAGAARQGAALRRRAAPRHEERRAACLAVMGLQFGYMLGGSILVETVFAWPGTGF